MRSLSHLLSILILTALSFYGYHNFYHIPDSILAGIVFLPLMLVLLVVGLCFHFNRSQIFFYVVLVVIANVFLGLHLTESALAYSLLSLSLPLMLIGFSLLPERGIIGISVIPSYLVLFVPAVISLLLIRFMPDGVSFLLLTDWLPARYFDWTEQSQSVVFVSVFAFIYMLVLYFKQPSHHMATGLGVLIMLISQLHFGDDSDSLNVFSGFALLMCLATILQESWRMAYLDELTELPGRRALREKFQKLSGTYTVAMLDVDHFKKFNDTYGHDTGDAVLRMIATKMRQVTGGGAAYRYGGEEFSIVFNGKNKQDSKQHLETLREKIASTPFLINRESRRKIDKKAKPNRIKSVTVTVSIGIADSKGKTDSTWTSNKVLPWDVLKKSDKALYRAKKKGRNCVCS